MRTVQIANGQTNIELPYGLTSYPYNSGQVVVLMDSDFAKIEPKLFPGTVIDLGPVASPLGGVGNSTLQYVYVPVTLSAIVSGTVISVIAGFAGTLISARFIVTTAVTTAAKAATLTTNIATVNTTGGAIALTSANCTPAGAHVEGSAITAANTIVRGNAIGVKPSAVTAFVEGAGAVEMLILPS